VLTGARKAARLEASRRPRRFGRVSWRRIAILSLLPVYGGVYATWFVFRWGDAALQLAIADAAFIPMGIVAVAAAWVSSRRTTNDAVRRAWQTIGFAFAAFALGDVTWFVIEVAQRREVPFPSLADLGYLAFFPLMLVGLRLLPRERAEGRLRSALDMAIVMVGAGTAVWWLALGPVVAASGGVRHGFFVALAYPVGDTLVLFALLAALLARLTETRRVVLTLLAVGLALNVVADLAYARLALDADYASGSWLDLAYVLGWVAMGSAALIQATSPRARSARTSGAALSPITFLPYLAISAVYVPLAASTFLSNNGDAVLVGGAIVVTALVVGRQILTARENAALLAMQATATAAARFQALIKNASDVILVIDAAGQITFATPSAEELFGREVTSLYGASVAALLDTSSAPVALALLEQSAVRPGLSAPLALRIEKPSERWIEMRVSNLLADPLVAGLVATIHDITERRAFEQQLESQALHDPLTGLANRVLFADRVDQAIVRGRRSRRQPAILYLDLDDFKHVNETLGHPAGDEVLVEVARRIRSTARSEDTAARLGGDEFAVLVDETSDAAEAIALAERLEAAFAPEVAVAGSSFSLGCSIGIVRGARGASSSEMLRNADLAMRSAKRQQGSSFQVFEQQMYAAAVERVRLDADLKLALDRGEFEVVYQPLIALADGELNGVEALLRWHHPERGDVSPGDFIAAAERSGEIRRIGLWTLEQACATVGAWNRGGRPTPIRANVNVSVVQLAPEFPDEMAAILAATRFPARQLVIEITESVFSEDRAEVVEILRSLRRLGVRISIDDFGTGYSSLSRLRDLPVDELKIDRAFVSHLRGAKSGDLVAAIVHLAKQLSLGTVAEGVETKAQMEQLRKLGCELGQGYLFGKPATAAGLEERMMTHSWSEEAAASA
jgi:diguanylate cyclase (GGDEF)-like protein/PAS domain S-box-containing protein